MAEELVRVERSSEGVARVTLARPEALNALSRGLVRALHGAQRALAAEPGLRAVILTGEGDRAFCAGADLRERRGMTLDDTRAFVAELNACFDDWARLPMATIAALNGVAFGGGLELALCCDLRLALPAVQLGLVEVRVGILPGAGGTQRLPRLVGAARAKELILLGRRLDARRALEIGLVHEVVDDLPAALDRVLGELAGCAPRSVAKAKEAIDRGGDVALEEGLRIERRCYEAILGTEDRDEGLRAFAEKRPPRFVGR